MKKFYVLFFVLCVFSGYTRSVIAATDCIPIFNGGYSCYDYDRNAFVIVTPQPGGGFTTFDLSTGALGAITTTPRRDGSGGYNTFNYGTGEFDSITPMPNGGFRIEK